MRTPQIGFSQLVQDFFLRRLIAQRGASARTIEAYRDAFELLFGFVEDRTGKPPSALQLADLDAPFVLDFLGHCCIKPIGSPDLVHLLAQKLRSRSRMPGLLRFFKMPEGPASPLWWVARTPFALMQQCRLRHESTAHGPWPTSGTRHADGRYHLLTP